MAFEIQLENLNKQFGEFTVLKDFSESVRAGDRISVLGHNGAGKSTLLNLIATLTHPTSGKIHYTLDGNPISAKKTIRTQFSYLSHESMLYPDLTALENLRFVAGIYGLQLGEERTHELLTMVGLEHAQSKLFRTFSRGMQQRLSLARALLTNPKLLLLDEPFSGLDNEGVASMREYLNKSDYGWVMVTHDRQTAFEMANRIWILHRGRLTHALNKSALDFETFSSIANDPAGKSGAKS